jgi:hypothetical protein
LKEKDEENWSQKTRKGTKEVAERMRPLRKTDDEQNLDRFGALLAGESS